MSNNDAGRFIGFIGFTGYWHDDQNFHTPIRENIPQTILHQLDQPWVFDRTPISFSDRDRNPPPLPEVLMLCTESLEELSEKCLEDCDICMSEYTLFDKIELSCKHVFCSCIIKWIICNPTCPNCRVPIDKIVTKKIIEWPTPMERGGVRLDFDSEALSDGSEADSDDYVVDDNSIS